MAMDMPMELDMPIRMNLAAGRIQLWRHPAKGGGRPVREFLWSFQGRPVQEPIFATAALALFRISPLRGT